MKRTLVNESIKWKRFMEDDIQKPYVVVGGDLKDIEAFLNELTEEEVLSLED
jgi:L-ribulose-5-phosphate 3-epimerase UlaE